jgi:hypothetical protein
MGDVTGVNVDPSHGTRRTKPTHVKIVIKAHSVLDPLGLYIVTGAKTFIVERKSTSESPDHFAQRIVLDFRHVRG